MDVLYYIQMVLFITICIFLILLVLIQKGRGGGISSAFGGSGGNTAFGNKTGDVLTWATSIVFGIFMLLAIFLNLTANQVGKSKMVSGASTMAIPSPQPAPANNIPPAIPLGQ